MEGPSELVLLGSDDEMFPEQEGDCDEIPEWMDFPAEEGENDSSENKMRRVMCIAWLAARKQLLAIREESRYLRNWINLDSENRMAEERRRRELSVEGRRRSEEIRREWGELSPEEELRAGWKVSEREFLTELTFLIWAKKDSEIEQAYSMKRQLKEAQEKGLQQDKELMQTKYHNFRNKWTATHSHWGGAFEDITAICSMGYTNGPVPRYVYIHGPPDTLQIYSIKVQTKEKQGRVMSLSMRPLHVFGLIAVRDPVDQSRNIIFNRERYDCQAVSFEDPYLVLTGPTRAVVVDDKSVPVTIEAELTVKGRDESDDKPFIFAYKPLPSEFGSGSVNIDDRFWVLSIEVGRVITCVESTIFLRIIDGTWPAGYNGQFTACTSSDKEKKIMLVKFRGDLPMDGGIVKQSRFALSVEVFGELIVSYIAWRHGEWLQGEVSFNAEKKGRSRQSFQIGTCTLEVIVAWSPIRPVCEELVSTSEMDFTK